jgi:hypothetical protein
MMGILALQAQHWYHQLETVSTLPIPGYFLLQLLSLTLSLEHVMLTAQSVAANWAAGKTIHLCFTNPWLLGAGEVRNISSCSEITDSNNNNLIYL